MKKLVFILFILTFACSGVSITGVHKEEGFSISRYKSFNFYEVDASGDGLGDAYKEKLTILQNAIIKQMGLKGLTTTTSNPDLLVNIGIAVTQEVQTRETSFNNPADRTAYMGQRNYSWSSQEVVVGHYRQGTVTLDFVDKATGKLVWQGSAESVVPEKEKSVPSLIEEAMAALFAKVK